MLPVLGLFGACQGPSQTELRRARIIQDRIDALEALHDELRIPKHLTKGDARKLGGEFEVMQTMRFFPHLHLEDGYVLDYVYEFGGIGGEPIIYARKTSERPFEDIKAFLASVREQAHLDEVDAAYRDYRAEAASAAGNSSTSSAAFDRLEKRLSDIPDHDVAHWYLKHVSTDGSDESFIELATLRVVADQFYLFWHALYNDSTPVLTKEKAAKVLSGAPKQDYMPTSVRPPEITASLLCPRVERTATSVVVTLHLFSRWGGLSRRTFEFTPNFPHRLTEREPETVVPFYCTNVY